MDNFYAPGTHKGKPCLDDSQSFRFKECIEHWRREIKQAVGIGKTVIVYLPPLQKFYIDTGRRSYSGTGRNQRIERHVQLYDNYKAIPIKLLPLTATGSSMKLVANGAEILAPYWTEFEKHSSYHVQLTEPEAPACITTQTGNKAVGALSRSQTSSGTLLCLPDIDFDDDRFIKQNGEEQVWTDVATQFAGRFIASIVALDKALRASSEVTPEPSWVSDPRYVLGQEAALRVQLLEAERRVEEAQKEKEAIVESLTAAGRFRALLFEKGKPLEHVIIEALQLMGFKAAPFRESESEFDVVFECDEGRLIGEAEGKDNKAINIDKLRQLSMNIHEDLQRDEVSAPAKAVLFGNGFRLEPVQERADPFTQKCYTAAATSSTALVATSDLFMVVQHLMKQSDPEFAHLCRQALLGTTGRVAFPPVPPSESPSIGIEIDEQSEAR